MSNTTLHKIQTRFLIGRISKNMPHQREVDRADISRRPRSLRYIFRLRTRDQKLDNAAFALEPTLFYIAPALDMVGLHIVDKHTERTE